MSVPPVRAPSEPRRAGVLGSPVAHSLSPALHRAAYRALGLRDWSYDAARVEAADLAAHVAALDETWVGLSVTMPLKEAALALATSATDLARRSGSANTLVRSAQGWHADNTDVEGIVRAVREAGAAGTGGGPGDPATIRHVLVVGSGATSRSAVEAARGLGAHRVTFMVRSGARPETLAHARGLGLETAVMGLGEWPTDPDLVVATVPAEVTSGWAGSLPRGVAVVLDAVYGHGPSPLLQATAGRATVAVPGTTMLLHQAARQVELMTGRPAPLESMRAGLEVELAARAAGPSRAADLPSGAA